MTLLSCYLVYLPAKNIFYRCYEAAINTYVSIRRLL